MQPLTPKPSGILVVDKPLDFTSTDVVRKLKKYLPKKTKIGHGGTLDPFATGLMVVLIGEATKVADFILHGTKEYIGQALIGWETDTADCLGEKTVEAESVPQSLSAFENVKAAFVGRIEQEPPLYSAVKVNGKPLYKYARQGIDTVIPTREVEILDFQLHRLEENKLDFRVRCGGGTYIRSLLRDLARAAESRSHLTQLRRIQSNQFTIDQAYTLEHIESVGIDACLLPLTSALGDLLHLQCTPQEKARIQAGNQQALGRILLENMSKLAAEQPLQVLIKCENVPVALIARDAARKQPYTFQRVFA